MKAILTWHAIDESQSPICVGEAAFADQVAFLASRRVRVTRLADILAAEDDAVALTFDDAFASFTERAWPRLRDAGLPATVFVVTDHVGECNRWGNRREPGIPDLALASWDSLARVAAEGAEIGCHSRRHPRLDTIDDAALEEETYGACQILRERLGVAATSYCYPFGVAGRRERDVAARQFKLGVTTEHRLLKREEDPFLLPRLDVFYFNRPGALNSFGSDGFRTEVMFRAALRRLRRIATG
jgi:peptidoglycan/xylan/chitin deacetylase (PgdA/CDA1 family)